MSARSEEVRKPGDGVSGEGRDPRRVTRIPVDAVLLFRTVGNSECEQCDVTTISALSLEMWTERPLANGTIVSLAVQRHGRSTGCCTVAGVIRRRESLNGRWLHIVTAPNKRPWSPSFICQVVCSTFNPSSQSVEAFVSTYGYQKLALQNIIRESLTQDSLILRPVQ